MIRIRPLAPTAHKGLRARAVNSEGEAVTVSQRGGAEWRELADRAAMAWLQKYGGSACIGLRYVGTFGGDDFYSASTLVGPMLRVEEV